MNRRSTIVLLTGVAALAGLVVPGAASAQTPSPTPSDKTILTMGSVYDLLTPNPFKAESAADTETVFLTYDQLYRFDQKTLGPASGLAYYPPDKSADGLAWTFRVRSGVTWSDGEPFTAKDIAFTYNFIWHNELGAYLNYLGYPESFTAPDDTTFVWKMAKPTLAPLAPPWIPILPEHVWAKYDGEDAKAIKEVQVSVGTGPFTFEDWKPGQYWSLAANEHYWDGAPNIDGVVFRVFNNPEALKLALVDGEVDAVDALPPNVFASLQSQPGISTNVSAPNYFDNLAFNFEGTGDPSLRDLKVRRAIEYSIDKQALVDRVTLGYGLPGESIVLPTYGQWVWKPDASQAMNHDPVAAGALLDEAGYVDVDGDGFRETPDGDPWSMQILTISDVLYSVPEGKLIAGWMNDVGIKTSLKTVTESKAYDLWYAQDFDMYIWAWGPDPDPDFMLSVFTEAQCLNWSDGCWSDPEYENLYEQQHGTLNVEERKQLIVQAQQLLYEQVPEVVLLYEQDLQAYRNDRFTGYLKQPEPEGSLYFAFGPASYLNIRPVAASGGAESAQGSGGSSPIVWIVVVALIAVAGAGVVLMRRRRGASEDVE